MFTGIAAVNQTYCSQSINGAPQFSFQVLVCAFLSRWNSKDTPFRLIANTGTCDQCQFDGKDSSDCKDYGMIDKEIVPWPMGSQDCKKNYGIKITSIDPSLTCSSSNSFVNSLKNGDLAQSNAKFGLGVSEGGFFEQDPNTALPVLKDSITIGGKSYNCKASQSNCYNAMKPYFANNPNGQKEMKDVCNTLYNKYRNDQQMEQSTLRIRLCNESRKGEVIPSFCNPLWPLVEQKMKDYPKKACPGFGMGVGSTPIPGCPGTTSSITSRTTSIGNLRG